MPKAGTGEVVTTLQSCYCSSAWRVSVGKRAENASRSPCASCHLWHRYSGGNTGHGAPVFSFPLPCLNTPTPPAGERKNGRLWFENCTNSPPPSTLANYKEFPISWVQSSGDLPMATSTRKIGRDAKTGEFIPVKEAQKRPSTSVVETIKKPAATPPKPKKK